jgi:hypothetical protein
MSHSTDGLTTTAPSTPGRRHEATPAASGTASLPAPGALTMETTGDAQSARREAHRMR